MPLSEKPPACETPDLPPVENSSEDQLETPSDLTPRQIELRDFFSELEFTVTEADGTATPISFTAAEAERLARGWSELSTTSIEHLKEVAPTRFQENISQFNITTHDWRQAALNQPSLFVQLPETIQDKYEIIKLLPEEEGNPEQAWEIAEKLPTSLACAEDRLFIHYLYKKIKGKLGDLTANPEKLLEKHFQEEQEKGEAVDFAKLQRILAHFRADDKEQVKEKRKRRKEAKAGE